MADGQLSGQCHDGTLASCVGKLGGCASDKCYDTRSVDYTGGLLFVLSETYYRVLAAEPYTLHVDSLGKIPDLLRRINRISIVGVHYAGVVEEDVKTTPGVDMLNHGFYVGFLGDIGNLGFDLLGIWDELLQSGNGPLECRTGDIGEQNVGAFTGEEDASLQTNTTGAILA